MLVEIADARLVYGWVVGWTVAAPFVARWFWRRERNRWLAVACLAVALSFLLYNSATRFQSVQLGAGTAELRYLFGLPSVRVSRQEIAGVSVHAPPWRGDTALFLRLTRVDGRALESLGGERPEVRAAHAALLSWLGDR